MGRRGPPRLPTAVKIARGTHRKDRHGDPEDEPRPDNFATLPAAPKALGKEGRKVWKEKGAQLVQLGLLTPLDVDAFRRYCETFDEIAWFLSDIEQNGRTSTTENGYEQNRPTVSDLKDVRREQERLRQQFGMTPSARSGLKVEKSGRSKVMSRTRGA